MIRKNVLFLFSLLLFVVIFLPACNFDSEETGGNTETSDPDGTASNTSESAAKVLNIDDIDDISSLDSMKAHDDVNFTVLNHVMEGLYRRDRNSQPYLAQAEKHEVSEDGLVHTFTIREGVKWNDGTPVTAHDFEFAWKKVMYEQGHYNSMFETAAVLNAAAILNEEMDPAELGVKAVDERTLEVTLEYPNPLLAQLLSFPTFFPQNQEFVERMGDQYGLEHNTTLYNGPFVLNSWRQAEGWQYKKNPDYWDKDNIYLDEVNVYIVKDVSTSINLFETGQIDRVRLSAAYVDQYRDRDDFQIIKDPQIIFLRFNHTHPALGNVNIRRAIDIALDKEGLTDVILNNGSSPLYGLVPGEFYFSPEGEDFRVLNGEYHQGTVEEALDYWNLGLQETGLSEVKVSLNLSDEDDMRKTGEYIKNQLESNLPGFELELRPVPFQQRLTIERAVEYDLSLSTWGPDYADPMTYIDMWVTDGSANRMKYSNPTYDELVAQAKVEADLSKRYQIMLDLEKMLIEEDAAIAPIYSRGYAILQRSNVKDFVMLPTAPKYNFLWTKVE